MDDAQRKRIADLLAGQHVAVLVIQEEQWPSATLQAFAETPELDLLFILHQTSAKFQSALKWPKVSVMVDARESGDLTTFRVNRVLIQGLASEVPRESWEPLKKLFIGKNPFEAPFFEHPELRMLRITPARASYAGADYHNFKTEF